MSDDDKLGLRPASTEEVQESPYRYQGGPRSHTHRRGHTVALRITASGTTSATRQPGDSFPRLSPQSGACVTGGTTYWPSSTTCSGQ